MEITVKYFDPNIPHLEFNGDWVDLRASSFEYSVTSCILEAEANFLKFTWSSDNSFNPPYNVYIPSDRHVMVRTGVGMILPLGYEAIILPRSSTIKYTGMIWTSSGVIDNSYCGEEDEWFMTFYTTKNCKLEYGQRLAQFRIQKKQPALNFIEGELMEKSRGGFGSTGRV